jgi:hypothetical protein
MRALTGLIGFAALAAAGALPAGPAGAVCSVFDREPCAPTMCSVFGRWPCIPEIDYPIGQDLRLTIESASANANAPVTDGNAGDIARPEIGTIRDLFKALRGCWIPPAEDEARPGMQMSVRLAFKRSGEIMAEPRVTYATPDAPRAAREVYRHAITAALARCTPLPFTAGLGGAVAGRPIAIRYVDNRGQP